MRRRMSASLSVCPTGMDTHLLVPSVRVTHCLGCCSAICGGFKTLGGGDDGGFGFFDQTHTLDAHDRIRLALVMLDGLNTMRLCKAVEHDKSQTDPIGDPIVCV